MLRTLLVAVLALLLGACSRGPDQATLEGDLQRRLTQAFGEGVLGIAELQRRGSASDAKAPPEETRVVVYFDSELELLRDQDFGSWESPGVASLISALGAGPRGLSGVQSGGNRRGDRLKAHGSLIYRQVEGGWQVVVPQGFSAPRAPQPSEGGTGSPDELLIAAVGTALKLSPTGAGVSERQIIRDEMQRSLASIQGRLSRLHHGYPLAGGPAGGQYARFAVALGSLLGERGLHVVPLTTEGGVANLRMLRRGDVVLALSQSDAVHYASTGSGPFAGEGPYSQLRTLASLYPEPLHVLVRGAGPIRAIAGLRGQRVNLGQPGSASRDTALAVLAAHGLKPEDLGEAASLDLQQALAALRDGRLDAVIQVIGAPADQIRAASEALDLRLLPLDEPAVRQLVASRPGTFAMSLAAGSYPRQPAPVATLAVSSLLLCDQQFSAAEAEQLVRALFAPSNRWLAWGSIQGEQLSPANARRALTVPLHEGALRALDAGPAGAGAR